MERNVIYWKEVDGIYIIKYKGHLVQDTDLYEALKRAVQEKDGTT